MTPHPMLRLRLEFGPLVADFRGGPEQVAEVATALVTTGLAVTVTVDDRIEPQMPKLPCSCLWDEPRRGYAISHPFGEDIHTLISHTGPTGPTPDRSARFSEINPRRRDR